MDDRMDGRLGDQLSDAIASGEEHLLARQLMSNFCRHGDVGIEGGGTSMAGAMLGLQLMPRRSRYGLRHPLAIR